MRQSHTGGGFTGGGQAYPRACPSFDKYRRKLAFLVPGGGGHSTCPGVCALQGQRFQGQSLPGAASHRDRASLVVTRWGRGTLCNTRLRNHAFFGTGEEQMRGGAADLGGHELDGVRVIPCESKVADLCAPTQCQALEISRESRGKSARFIGNRGVSQLRVSLRVLTLVWGLVYSVHNVRFNVMAKPSGGGVQFASKLDVT